ncbi:MAG TPA: glutamate--cysteine ligase, partial [Arenibaculum sp.]|nr:glutamate--cysteine ligase [Arenibaculum sp.]
RQLAGWFAAGSKPRGTWGVGTEHEKFGFFRDDFATPAYERDGRPGGIRAVLDGLAAKGWAPILDAGNPIGLKRGGASISLEPAGQFELSGDILPDLHATHLELQSHLRELHEVSGPLGLGFAPLGFHPTHSREEMPWMPKGRYAIMRRYMPKVGSLGLDMMLRTCTVQANLDFENEADMVAKFRMSLALQPIATALFANSPFTEGKPNGYLSYRAHIWTDTDPDRTGMLDFVFEDGFGFERYARYALDVPMYFAKRNGRYVDLAGRSFRKFMDGKLDELPGERATLKDWTDHATTIFPEVRLKQYLEMRGADSGPWSRICALPALWTGVFYDAPALAAAWDLCKHWTAEDRASLRADAPKLGLKASVAGRSVQDVAKDFVAIAREGLKRRNRLDGGFVDETGYLGELEAVADSGITPAERLLERYHGAWNGDVSRVFEEAAY